MRQSVKARAKSREDTRKEKSRVLVQDKPQPAFALAERSAETHTALGDTVGS